MGTPVTSKEAPPAQNLASEFSEETLGAKLQQSKASVSAACRDLGSRSFQVKAEPSVSVEALQKAAANPDTITAPDGLSQAGALKGLWNCSKFASFFQMVPNGDTLRKEQAAAAWKSQKEVEKLLKEHPYVDYFGGKCIKTDMSKFPLLDLTSYRKQCNIQMPAEQILNQCLLPEKQK